jgi:hypothetical protein
MTKNDAETIAAEALNFLAGDESRLVRFLDLSGLDPGSIRAAARSSDFLAGVLDYVCGDEVLLTGFASHLGIRPDLVEQARVRLGGRPQHNVP